MRISSRRTGLAVLAAALVVAGSVAYAAIPDSTGVVHACYSPKDAAKQGAPLKIIDSASGSCAKNQLEVTWNQTGPPGAAGADGVSVTSAALSAGDANCPAGGSQFTAAGGNVTYACHGLEGAKGDKGDPGNAGPPGPSEAYSNHGGPAVSIADGNTVTVASVTVPAGTYVLNGVVRGSGISSLENLQCSFVAGGTIGQRVAVLVNTTSQPILADATLPFASNPVFLRCLSQGGTIDAGGQMIAIRVGSVTASQ